MPAETLTAIEELVRLRMCEPAVLEGTLPADWLATVISATGEEPADMRAGARLTLGIPGTKAANHDFTNHLFWWPDGVPPVELVGVVSSRLSRDLERWQSWFLGLRALCAAVDGDCQRLMIAADSTTGRFASRAAGLFGVPSLQLQVATGGSLRRWWKAVIAEKIDSTHDHPCVCVSPSITETEKKEPPLRDALVVALADRLTALYVRPKGNVAQLLRARLDDPRHQPTSVRLLLGQGLTTDAMRDDLMQRGCVGWNVFSNNSPPARVADDHSTAQAGAEQRTPIDSEEKWTWLTHCTRRCDGPWPRQPDEEYLDQLILETQSVERSAMATLRRIVLDRRLIASAEGVRGSTRVVCFTAVPLAELRELRVFRAHRGRWDFQPYGICIDREWMQDRGARPVHYSSPERWDEMPEGDRPFFQVEESLTRAGNTIDWTVESEWRTIGDVLLASIPRDAAFLFLPAHEEAVALAAISPWPVHVLADPHPDGVA